MTNPDSQTNTTDPAMHITKLERSFDAKELHRLLSSSLSKHGGNSNSDTSLDDPMHDDDVSVRLQRIKRPALPPGSSTFEQTRGELEIESQSQKNGKETLPSPSHAHASSRSGRRGNLSVPAPSPMRCLSGRRSPRCPSPYSADTSLAVVRGGVSPGRRSPYLEIHGAVRPSSGRRTPTFASRSASPNPVC